MGTLLDLTGQEFGRLAVLTRVGTRGSFWRCRCLCGKVIVAKGEHLRRGYKQSCNCLRDQLAAKRLSARKLAFGQANRNGVYADYQESARQRGLEWSLGWFEFDVLTLGDCHYCGRPPSNLAKDKSKNGEYRYNGIDRQDNNRGYVKDNCVSCCRICNLMKRTMSEQEFRGHVERIFRHLTKSGRAFSQVSGQ